MLQQAIAFHKKGQLAEAATLYRKIPAENPNNADALHLLGVTEFQRGNPSAAIALIERAIKLAPNNADLFSNLGLALQNLKRLDDALASYDRALALKPDDAVVLSNRGNALRELKRFDEALASYDRALEIKPDYAEALNNRGSVLGDLKRRDDALASYDRALAIKPDYARAFNNRGNVLRDLKRLDDALASYDRALAIKPDYAEALNGRGITLRELARFDDALDSYDRALAIKPDYAEALNNRGNALRDLKRRDDALASYDRALAIKPDYAEALVNRGATLQDLKRFDDALGSYDRALAIKPNNAEALNRRGILLANVGKSGEAEAQFRQALAIKPDYVEARLNLGSALLEQERLEEAISEAEIAATFDSRMSFPHYLLGTLLARCGRKEAARKQFEIYLEREPEDGQGARMFLAGLGFERLPERAPDALLKKTYARRAAWWDLTPSQTHLYRGAELVAEVFEKSVDDSSRFNVLDAGCGTGSVGKLIHRRVRRLAGIDLSPEMLERAKEKGVYHELHQGDLVAFLANHAEHYDAVTSAATLIHFSDLRPVFEAAATALRDDGLFIFTLFPNEHDDAAVAVGSFDGLAQGGCYAHGRGYVAHVAAETQFRVEVLASAIHEYTNKGKPVTGLVVALRRHARNRMPIVLARGPEPL